MTAVLGAAPGERTDTRAGYRNGHRPRTLTTPAGDLELRIPKLRAGSFFPSLLERRRRVDQALFAVVMEAYLHGVSTRKVDDLVKALGADSGISKSEVSRICAELDEEVSAFAGRGLAGQAFPYVLSRSRAGRSRGSAWPGSPGVAAGSARSGPTPAPGFLGRRKAPPPCPAGSKYDAEQDRGVFVATTGYFVIGEGLYSCLGLPPQN